MEDASSFGPFSVETTGIEESISFLKEEMIGNQLLLLGFRHGAERIESSSKFSSKGTAGLNNFLLNFISLLSSDAWTKRICFQVTANSNTG